MPNFSRLMKIEFLIFLFATAAMTAQGSPQTSADKVRVNVYRYKQYMGKGLRPSIYCNGQDIARLQSGRYVVLALAPGSMRSGPTTSSPRLIWS